MESRQQKNNCFSLLLLEVFNSCVARSQLAAAEAAAALSLILDRFK